MTKQVVFLICLLTIQSSLGQTNRIQDAIEKVPTGNLADAVTIMDHRGTRHTIFVKDGDIFYCIPKSDTINLSCTDARSSNPLPMLVADTLSLLWKEQIGAHTVILYRRHFILTPIGLWTRPTCVYTKTKEYPSPLPLPQGERGKSERGSE